MARRYMSMESLAKARVRVIEGDGDDPKEVVQAELEAATRTSDDG